MKTNSNKRKSLLDEIYQALDYRSGDLVDVDISKGDIGAENYLAKGQWLDTCLSINKRNPYKVDKLFFIQNNPVIVFVDANTVEKKEIFRVFNEIWSLARPRLVFVENNASVTIYDLGSNPAKSNEELKPLSDVITESKQILEKLIKFNREGIESGSIFREELFDSLNKRADLTLINDLKQAREKLFEHGLNGEHLKYAHALIGRSIFIRYLEDRGVITKEYFLKLAKGNKQWLDIIETPLQGNFYRKEMSELIYPRVLGDKELTFRLFEKIAEDFNGDTFTTDVSERNIVNRDHLKLLQNFLVGAGNTHQLPLFLWAYRFDVIPIDLISSIYEEFYHSENLIDEKTQKLKHSKGTHYTPSSLVEFVLSRTLTTRVLKKRPRILDPACGSGIFLVESFRRIVRYECYSKRKDSLELEELLGILKNQIAGIEINSEAIKIAAFSLYLSLLHYLNPPSILKYIKRGGKLPYLIWHGEKKKNHFNILLEGNSFDSEKTSLVLRNNTFDIVVGNPPWGTPDKTDSAGRNALQVIEEWCKKNDLEFPDKEPSQAFLFKALDFLRPKGLCSLLVSSGVLLKFSKSSNKYKQQLLHQSTLKEVINFSHVRRVFFSGAISPFMLIVLEKSTPKHNQTISYLSLRKSEIIDKNKVVLFERNDIKQIKYEQTGVNDIWKIFYWGNSYDFNLITSMRRFTQLKEYCELENCAQGFQEANKSKSIDWLSSFQEIPVKYFDNKYGSFDLAINEHQSKLVHIPPFVKVRGKPGMYEGKRILIRRGIIQKNVIPKRQIIARIESESFAFRHSIICIKLQSDQEITHECVIGIMWSSLFRYYMFMTASTWGTWRQEIHLNEVLGFPIAIPEQKVKNEIEQLVTRLKKEYRNESETVLRTESQIVKSLEQKLDDQIFDLYRLTDFERCLVKNRCDYDIDYYYGGSKSDGQKRIRNIQDVEEYVKQFNNYWTQSLKQHEYFEASILESKDKSMLGVVFQLKDGKSDDNKISKAKVNIGDFNSLLRTKTSKNVYTDGLFRRISDDQIVIIKRNHKSNWSNTQAKIDADATLLHVLKRQLK